jgi:hypothetical protein
MTKVKQNVGIRSPKHLPTIKFIVIVFFDQHVTLLPLLPFLRALSSRTLKMEAVCFSEMLVSTFHITRHDIKEDSNLNIHCRKNFKFHTTHSNVRVLLELANNKMALKMRLMTCLITSSYIISDLKLVLSVQTRPLPCIAVNL